MNIEDIGVQITPAELRALKSALTSFRTLYDMEIDESQLGVNQHWKDSLAVFQFLKANHRLLLPTAREFAFNTQPPIFFSNLIYSAFINPFIPLDLNEMHLLVDLYHRIKNAMLAANKNSPAAP